MPQTESGSEMDTIVVMTTATAKGGSDPNCSNCQTHAEFQSTGEWTSIFDWDLFSTQVPNISLVDKRIDPANSENTTTDRWPLEFGADFGADLV